MKLIGLEDLPDSIKVVFRKENLVALKSVNSKHIIKIKIPFKSTPELASLIGHVLGDGHIKPKGQQFHFINKDIRLIENVKNDIEFIFGIKIKEHSRIEKQIFELFIPAVVAKLLILAGAPEGRKSTQIFHVPNWIIEGDEEIKSSFIKALFDDEAWVEIVQGGFCIGFGQNKKVELLESHKIFLEEVRRLLFDLEINTSKIFQRSQKADSIQLGFKIVGLKNLLNFNSKVGFNSRHKQKRLEFIINNFKQIQFGKKEAKLKLLEELKNNQMKSKELAEKLNRDQKTIWKHLNQLRKRNLIVKIGTKNKVFWKVNDLNNINPKIKEY